MTGADKYVWIWLPHRTTPILAGRLVQAEQTIGFEYDEAYLRDPNAISLYAPELPLIHGVQRPARGMEVPGCIRDAAPDAWGRHIIGSRITRELGTRDDPLGLGELVYLEEVGSDRIGALDVQASATRFEPRENAEVSPSEMLAAVRHVQQGRRMSCGVEWIVRCAVGVGGARPKALLTLDDRKVVAKFAGPKDAFNVVGAEFFLMRMAHAIGLDVAGVDLLNEDGADIMLINRFDRHWLADAGGWTRSCVVSSLTIQELDEMTARYASYEDLARIVRERFRAPDAAARELFGRMVFNVIGGNTDDHARNHAATWDGEALTLTPAYDLCPQPRTGGEAGQAMRISGDDNRSRIASCLSGSSAFGLSRREALSIVMGQLESIRTMWRDAADRGRLTIGDRRFLAGRQILNPYAFQELTGDEASLASLAAEIVFEMQA